MSSVNPLPNPSNPPFNPGGDGVIQNPNAQHLANFIDDAHDAGYFGGVDPLTIGVVGHTLGNNNNAKLTLAQMKQASAIPNKSSQYLYEPSAVSPAQTPAKVISDHISNTGIAPIPVAQIKQMQQTLMDAKLDGQSGLYTPPNAKVDGVWNSDWANAAYQYQQDQKNQPGLGNTGARDLFGTVFGSSFWSHAIPFVTSILKAIPGETLKSLGDVVKPLINDFYYNTRGVNIDPSNLPGTELGNYVANLGNKIEGQAQTSNSQFGKVDDIGHSLLNVGNLALMFSGVGDLGSGALDAGRGAIAAGTEAGASNAAKALVTKVDPLTPKGPLNWIMNSVLPDTGSGSRFAFTKWLRNSPSASRIAPGLTPALDNAATGIKNAYQVTRRIAASPYRLPIVGAAGKIGTDISTAGLKFGIQGHLDNWMGDPNAPVAYQLDHLKPISGLLGAALNGGQMLFHGTSYTGDGQLSGEVGKTISDAMNQLADTLNKMGYASDWERATGLSIPKLIEEGQKAGLKTPALTLYSHIMDQANQFAAEHAAQPLVDQARADGRIPEGNNDAEFLFQRNEASAIRQDAQKMKDAHTSYFAKTGQFDKDIRNQMLISRQDPMSIYSKGLMNKLKADELYRNGVIPHVDQNALGGNSKDDTSWMAQGLNDAPADGRTTVMSSDEVKAATEDAAKPLSKSQLIQIQRLMKSKGIAERDARLKYISDFIQRDVKSTNDLTKGEAGRLIKKMSPTQYTVTDAQNAALADKPIIGRIGFQRNELPTANDAEAKAMEFAQELQGAKPGYFAPKTVQDLLESSDGTEFGALEKDKAKIPKSHLPENETSAETALRAKVLDFLGHELGRDTSNMKFVHTQDLIKLIAEKAKYLAGDLKIAEDAHPELLKTIEDGKALGYKPVVGHDIGLQLHHLPIDYEKMGATLNDLSRGLDKIGVNFKPMSDEASLSSIAAKNKMQDVVDSIKATRPADIPTWATADRLMNYAQSVIKKEIPTFANAAIGVSASRLGKLLTLRGLNLAKGGAWKDELQSLIEKGGWDDADGVHYPVQNMTDAKNVLKKILTQDSSPQTWLRNEFINAMTAKGNSRGLVENKFGDEVEPVGMSTKDASDLWYAMQKGLRNAPAYQGGFNPLSKMMKSTFGAANLPLQINGRRVLDLTGPIQDKLIQARYLYSPRQAYLRVVKSALKGVNENMPVSFNPDASFKELPQVMQDNANALADKLYGKSQIDFNAPETREFASADYFNIFNPRATLARTIHYVQQNIMDEKYAKASLNPLPADLKLKVETPHDGVVETKPIWDPIKQLAETKTQSNDNYKVSFVDKETNKEVGKLLWNKDDGIIQSVRVDPKFQGKGVAKAMMANALKTASENNLQPPIHSTLLTADGKAWKEALGKNELFNFTPADEKALKSRVDAINNYGDRSAAEKTLNGFFFPFSFEKTVVRELGAHLLDNPSTRLLTAAAIHVYNSSDGQKMDKWLQNNVPLWKEAEKFNPFYHGEGLGQFGGINRVPEGIIGKALYGNATIPDFSKVSDAEKLNLFVHMLAPKPITSQASVGAMVNLIPAVKDLNNIFVGADPNGKKPTQWGGEVWASARDLAHQANAAIHKIAQQPEAHWQTQGYQPYDLQQTNAWNQRSQYITALTPALAANASGSDYLFPADTPKVGGLKITRSNINTLVNYLYPKWNPNLASYALARDTASKNERLNIQNELAKTTNPQLLAAYDNFTTSSDRIQTQITKDSLDPTFDPSQVAVAMDQMRQLAAYLAANDPTFMAFYNKYYASKYGPLKGL